MTTSPTRRHNWQSLLDALILDRTSRPFVYGTQDCCMFVCDCVEAITGHDPGADLRGTYTAEQGAQALVERLGGVAAIAADRLGEEIGPLLAQVGDVVLVQFEGRDTLAVCLGTRAAVPGPAGLVMLPMRRALRAWRCMKAG